MSPFPRKSGMSPFQGRLAYSASKRASSTAWVPRIWSTTGRIALPRALRGVAGTFSHGFPRGSPLAAGRLFFQDPSVRLLALAIVVTLVVLVFIVFASVVAWGFGRIEYISFMSWWSQLRK